MNKRPRNEFRVTGVAERTNEQVRRILLVAQILDAEQAWLTTDEVYRAYSSRVGKICKRTIRRHLQLLVCTGVVEERPAKRSRWAQLSEFKFDSWPLPLGG